MLVNLILEKSMVESESITYLPGRNLSEEGFGVGLLWIKSDLKMKLSKG